MPCGSRIATAQPAHARDISANDIVPRCARPRPRTPLTHSRTRYIYYIHGVTTDAFFFSIWLYTYTAGERRGLGVVCFRVLDIACTRERDAWVFSNITSRSARDSNIYRI